jgi:hypothetical protein
MARANRLLKLQTKLSSTPYVLVGGKWGKDYALIPPWVNGDHVAIPRVGLALAAAYISYPTDAYKLSDEYSSSHSLQQLLFAMNGREFFYN